MNLKISYLSSNRHDGIEALLWDVLWKPLSFGKEIRNELRLESEEIILIANVENKTVGVLVVNVESDNVYEIRHIAVRNEYQKIGIGKKLIRRFEKDKIDEKRTIIRTISRNTSLPFFKKLGFRIVKDYPDHPKFIKHGITFSLMEKEICTEQIV